MLSNPLHHPLYLPAAELIEQPHQQPRHSTERCRREESVSENFAGLALADSPPAAFR
jgi:hypothetical protein